MSNENNVRLRGVVYLLADRSAEERQSLIADLVRAAAKVRLAAYDGKPVAGEALVTAQRRVVQGLLVGVPDDVADGLGTMQLIVLLDCVEAAAPDADKLPKVRALQAFETIEAEAIGADLRLLRRLRRGQDAVPEQLLLAARYRDILFAPWRALYRFAMPRELPARLETWAAWAAGRQLRWTRRTLERQLEGAGHSGLEAPDTYAQTRREVLGTLRQLRRAYLRDHALKRLRDNARLRARSNDELLERLRGLREKFRESEEQGAPSPPEVWERDEIRRTLRDRAVLVQMSDALLNDRDWTEFNRTLDETEKSWLEDSQWAWQAEWLRRPPADWLGAAEMVVWRRKFWRLLKRIADARIADIELEGRVLPDELLKDQRKRIASLKEELKASDELTDKLLEKARELFQLEDHLAGQLATVALDEIGERVADAGADPEGAVIVAELIERIDALCAGVLSPLQEIMLVHEYLGYPPEELPDWPNSKIGERKHRHDYRERLEDHGIEP